MAPASPGRSEAPTPTERLVGLLQPERQDLTAIVVFAIFAGVLYLATPLAADALVNSLAFGANQGIYIQALIVLTLGLFGFLLLLGLIRGAQYFVTELIMRRLFVRLTADMAYRLPRVRMSALDQKLGPDLVNRFFDVVTVQKAASLLLLDGLNLVLGAFIGLLLLGVYHPFLLLFDLLLIAALSLVLFGFGRGAVRTSVAESYAKHDVASWLEQVAMFPYLFKSEGASRLAEAKANRLAETYLDARAKHYRIVIRQIGGLLGLQALASASLLGVGGFLVLDGQLTLGQLVAAELIVSAIVSNLASLGKHAELLYDALAAVDKIGYVVDMPIERSEGDMPSGQVSPAGASVSVEGVRFGYDPTRPVLDGVSFSIAPGERVALSGTVGSGVSTVLDMLLGLRAPQVGSVHVDGLDLRHWDLEALRASVTLVRGRDIVEATVFENVRFGRERYGRAEVQTVLERVGLIDEIMRLPQGLDTELTVGGRPLSSSQRMRLVLARAILGNPRLILIDGMLEGLDPVAFADLTSVLFDASSPWSVLVATHEPDVIARCNRTIDMAEFGPVRTGVTG